MKVGGFILLLLTIAGLTMSFCFFKRTYADKARDIRNHVGKNLAKKHHMDLVGKGGGMIDCVREISLSFQVRRILSQDEARWIVIDSVEELLKAFNENEDIRPHLLNYPFTTKNVSVKIFISNPDSSSVYYPNICIVGVNDEDFVTYKMEDNTGKTLKPIIEPYQEALAKVKSAAWHDRFQ